MAQSETATVIDKNNKYMTREQVIPQLQRDIWITHSTFPKESYVYMIGFDVFLKNQDVIRNISGIFYAHPVLSDGWSFFNNEFNK